MVAVQSMSQLKTFIKTKYWIHPTIPSSVSNEITNLSKKYAKLLVDKLNYIGTMCIEYFIDENDNLLVNEIAPRVHNSGHLTINAYNVSQFESHIRAVCNLEKIEPKMTSKAIMKKYYWR